MTHHASSSRPWLGLALALAPLALGACDPRVSIELPGDQLFPEGIAIDDDGTLLVGSLSDGSILRVDPSHYGSAIEVFSSGALERGAVGMTIDQAHDVLLVCDASVFDPSASALVALDLETGLALAHHPIPPVAEGAPVLCNDVIVDDDGTALLTESFGGQILRIHATDLLDDGAPAEPVLAGGDLAAVGEPAFGANGIAMLDDELYVVNINQGSLVHVLRDATGQALGTAVVPLVDEAGATVTLVGPDGIAASEDGSLLVVENGIFADGDGNRLSAIELDGGIGVVSTVADGFDIPTTVAEGEHYTWVVEGQLDHFLGLDPAAPDPFVVTGVLR